MAHKRKAPKLPTTVETAKTVMAAARRDAIVSGTMPRASTFDKSKARANKRACRGRYSGE